MANLLKKIEVGNPLINFGLYHSYDLYMKIDNDESHVKFLHDVLNNVGEDRAMVRSFIYVMMSHAIGNENLHLKLSREIESIKGVTCTAL
jgi:hypothetical protein